MRVDFYAIESFGARPKLVGSINDAGQVTGEVEWVANRHALGKGGGAIGREDDPLAWLKALHMTYRGSRFWATPVRSDTREHPEIQEHLQPADKKASEAHVREHGTAPYPGNVFDEQKRRLVNPDKDKPSSASTATPIAAKTPVEHPTFRGLRPEEKAIEDKAWSRVDEHYPELRAAYLNEDHNVTFNADGSIKTVTLNTDQWRPLFAPDGYVGTNSIAVQLPAGHANEMLFEELLKSMRGKGNNTVAIFAGGGGSGKGSALKKLDYPIQLDQVSAHKEWTMHQLHQISDAKMTPAYVFVDRDPEKAWAGVVGRAAKKEEGFARTVPLDVALNANIQARKTALEIIKENPELSATVVDNNGQPGDWRLITDRGEAIKYLEQRIAEAEEKVKSGLHEKLRGDVLKSLDSGHIPEHVARGLLGHQAIDEHKQPDLFSNRST